MPVLDQESIERNCHRLVRRCARRASQSILRKSAYEKDLAARNRDMLRGIQLVAASDVSVAALSAACSIVDATSVDQIDDALHAFDEKCRTHRAVMARLGRAAT